MSHEVVPWYNREEWLMVYEKIFAPASSTSSKKEALNTLLIWKARCPSLVSGIESTLSLLEVLVNDEGNVNAVTDDVLRLAYSSAVMRFVNHMLDSEQVKGLSLYQAARNLSVPDWVIDLRHNIAHSNSLPSLDLLRKATNISLDWLRSCYWDQHKEVIGDYIVGQITNFDESESKLSRIIGFCISLSICSHSQYKIKNLADVPVKSVRASIISETRELFGDAVDFSNFKVVSISSLIRLNNSHAIKLLKASNASAVINKSILGENSLFLSMEVFKLFNGREFYKNNILSKKYMLCFEVLLTFLHTNGLITNFLLDLIEITKDDCKDPVVRKLAAVWIREILKGLRKSQLFLDRLSRSQESNTKTPRQKKELRLLFQKWFPNEKKRGLILDLMTQAPRELTDLNVIRSIVATFNPYLTHFIKDLLNLVDPPLPKEMSERICKLAELISGQPTGFKNTVPKDRIFTVEDAKMECNYNSDRLQREGSADSDCISVSVDGDVEMEEHMDGDIWTLAPNSFDWMSCPLGRLPWQDLSQETSATD